MNLPLVCYNTNTNEDKKRLSILSKKLLQTHKSECKVLEALVATALVDDRSAAHWLVSHADDPSIGLGQPREFHLLLCPVNELSGCFDEFWSAYRGVRGWCMAMETPPHFELVRPFQCPACGIAEVLHAFNTVSRFYAERCLQKDIRLVLGTCSVADSEVNFQLDDDEAVGAALHEAGVKFSSLLRQSSLQAQAQTRPHRIVVCRDFQQAQQPQILKEIRRHFSLDERNAVGCHDTQWQLRLYSRDDRLSDSVTQQLLPVYKMRSECLQSELDGCLVYNYGDRVALVSQANPQRHGWGYGLNCETGLTGNFALAAAHRVPASTAWTLHKVVNLSSSVPSSPNGDSASSHWAAFSRQSSACADELSAVQPRPPSDASGDSSDSVAASPKPVGKSSSFSSFFSERPRRQLHVMRHGERLDNAAGFSWFRKAFDQRGVFVNRFDLNIPESLPTRPVMDFDYDTPLSLIGQFVSYHVGESLGRSGVRYSHCYCSPALRCVQTAHYVLSGAGQQQQQPIRIEPMLIELPYGKEPDIPRFLSPEQLRQSGYNVDVRYKPFGTVRNLEGNCTPEKYLSRLTKVFKRILECTKKKGGTVLIVGHRTTLEMCPQILLDRRCNARHLCIPYNAMLCLDEKSKRGWTIGSNPTGGFSITEHARFDGASLLAAA